MPKVDFSLYLITDRHQVSGRSLSSAVGEALKNGARAVQIREKDLLVRPLLMLARDIQAQAVQCGACCFINDRVDVCLSVPGAGIHLRSDSLPTDKVRQLVGSDRFVAVSTHTVDEVERAEQQGADFVVLGPIYDTPSKRSFGPPIGLDVLAAARQKTNIPIFAIGGITQAVIGEVIHAGAFGVAMISTIMSSPRVGVTTRAICREIAHHRNLLGSFDY